MSHLPKSVSLCLLRTLTTLLGPIASYRLSHAPQYSVRKFNLSFSGIRRCSYPQISTFICLSSFNNRRLCHKHHIIIPLLIVGSNKIALIVWLNNFTSKVVSLSYFDCVFLSPFSKTAPSSTPFSRSVWKKVYRD